MTLFQPTFGSTLITDPKSTALAAFGWLKKYSEALDSLPGPTPELCNQITAQLDMLSAALAQWRLQLIEEYRLFPTGAIDIQLDLLNGQITTYKRLMLLFYPVCLDRSTRFYRLLADVQEKLSEIFFTTNTLISWGLAIENGSTSQQLTLPLGL